MHNGKKGYDSMMFPNSSLTMVWWTVHNLVHVTRRQRTVKVDGLIPYHRGCKISDISRVFKQAERDYSCIVHQMIHWKERNKGHKSQITIDWLTFEIKTINYINIYIL